MVAIVSPYGLGLGYSPYAPYTSREYMRDTSGVTATY
jgi:hypothetical protein